MTSGSAGLTLNVWYEVLFISLTAGALCCGPRCARQALSGCCNSLTFNFCKSLLRGVSVLFYFLESLRCACNCFKVFVALGFQLCWRPAQFCCINGVYTFTDLSIPLRSSFSSLPVLNHFTDTLPCLGSLLNINDAQQHKDVKTTNMRIVQHNNGIQV